MEGNQNLGNVNIFKFFFFFFNFKFGIIYVFLMAPEIKNINKNKICDNYNDASPVSPANGSSSLHVALSSMYFLQTINGVPKIE